MADRLRKQERITIREARFDNWQDEIDNVHTLLNKALAHLDDHIGWHRDALESFLGPFKTIADPAMILFAEVEGEVVGFLPGVDNLNEIFINVNGLRYPWDTLHLAWLLKTARPKSLTVKSVLVLPEYWNRGVAVLLMDGLLNRAVSKDYEWVDMSITSADNPTSILTAEKLGAEIYKRWQVYNYPIS